MNLTQWRPRQNCQGLQFFTVDQETPWDTTASTGVNRSNRLKGPLGHSSDVDTKKNPGALAGATEVQTCEEYGSLHALNTMPGPIIQAHWGVSA